MNLDRAFSEGFEFVRASEVVENGSGRCNYIEYIVRKELDFDCRPTWIPVSEGLPKVADCYMVTRKIGSDLVTDACFFDGTDTWHDDNRRDNERSYLTDIIAWMPSPEAYNVGGRDKWQELTNQ